MGAFMAWDEKEFCGQTVSVGDKSLDEFSLALTKIAIEYVDRYGRKPTVAEVMNAFKIVMMSNSIDYFSDPEMIGRAIISLKGV
ncbi:MAG TPA: hypothetical protein VGD52_04395 [Pseudoduganella sp.]